MTNEPIKQAVIYCRVSSAAQTKRGDGLGSQETRCQEYANMRGYTVIAAFKDDVSGGLVDRPGMNAMLAHLKKHKKDPQIVLIDDISRLARGVQAHIELRAAISLAGGILESPTVDFTDDADGELQEYILATVAQHQRRKNAEQTKARMRARTMNGHYVFAKPYGYRYEKYKGQGNTLVRDEPLASIVTEALEGYASGRFQLQAEVKRFLETQPEFPKVGGGIVLNQTVTNLLKRVVYAGYIEVPKWDVSLRKGHHEALISFETYQRIQERLAGNAKTPARKDLNKDFPLRGAVTCGDCATPLTACWSKGRTRAYPYYLCPKRGCESYGKSIRREKVEGEFVALLKQLEPSENIFNLASAMFKELWNHRLVSGESRKRSLKTKLTGTERQIDQFLDRIADAATPSVITAYEKRIARLERDKVEIAEKIASEGKPVRDFDSTLRTALAFLANPYNLWASGRLEDQRAVLKLAFADRLSYARNEGFRTANLALPFKALAGFEGGDIEMARPERFELPTAWFVVFRLKPCILLLFIFFIQLTLSNKIGLFGLICLYLRLFNAIYWTAETVDSPCHQETMTW
ncbi:hypothetical protein MNBD_GAMMA13-702 [hydrothermal vent metagenome]|uniref:Recombinase n=1 Tax=hydrothermal vent metagenome TaxID=652676 RepID=A0A3B0YF56_9ZZZZ